MRSSANTRCTSAPALSAATGTAIGSDANPDYTAFSLQAIREHWDAAWDLFAQAVRYPTFPDEEVEQVRGQIVNQLRGRLDNPDAYLAVLANELLYEGHPYALDPLGTVETVGAITAADLRRWHGERLTKENLLIVVTWETAESTSAAFNPLATTRDMPGATDMNSVGVKDYGSLEQGLDASRDTLLLGAESYGYGAIVDSLRRCRSASFTARAINASAWCRGCVNGAYIVGLLPIVRASYAEHAARLVSTST